MAERADVIDEIANRLAERHAELTDIGVVEVGIPITISGMTQEMINSLFRDAARVAREFEVLQERPRQDGGISRILKEPTGVVAAIIPWNGPIGNIRTKVMLGLSHGCTLR